MRQHFRMEMEQACAEVADLQRLGGTARRQWMARHAYEIWKLCPAEALFIFYFACLLCMCICLQVQSEIVATGEAPASVHFLSSRLRLQIYGYSCRDSYRDSYGVSWAWSFGESLWKLPKFDVRGSVCPGICGLAIQGPSAAENESCLHFRHLGPYSFDFKLADQEGSFHVEVLASQDVLACAGCCFSECALCVAVVVVRQCSVGGT